MGIRDRLKIGSISCITVLMSVFLFGGCGKSTVTAPVLLEPVAVKLESQTAVKRTIFDASLKSARVVAAAENLSFVREGSIKELFVKIGDEVKEGQLLAILDSSQEMEAIANLEDEIAYYTSNMHYTVEQVSLNCEIAKLKLEELQDQGAIASDIELAGLQVQELEHERTYQKKLMELELEQLNNRLSALVERAVNYELYAVCDGTVTVCTKSVGDSVKSYETILCLADQSRLTIETEYMSEATVASYDTVRAVIGENEYEITYQPYNLKELGALLYSGEEISSVFTIDHIDDTVVAGLYAGIILTDHYKEEVLAIPTNAIYLGAEGNYVYVITNGSKEYRDVETGQRTAAFTEIISGLSEGEDVYVQQ